LVSFTGNICLNTLTATGTFLSGFPRLAAFYFHTVAASVDNAFPDS
jgi:hypothetical protein